MSAVSMTRLQVRSWRFLPDFLFHTILSALQAKNATGIQSATLLKDHWRAFLIRTCRCCSSTARVAEWSRSCPSVQQSCLSPLGTGHKKRCDARRNYLR
jgi:hypothetical protein